MLLRNCWSTVSWRDAGLPVYMMYWQADSTNVSNPPSAQYSKPVVFLLRQQQPVDQGAKTRLMRVLRRDSTQNVSATGQSAMSALGTQSPKATRDVRGFFRLNKQS